MDEKKKAEMEKLMKEHDSAVAQAISLSQEKDAYLADYKKKMVTLNKTIADTENKYVAIRQADPDLQRLSQKVG